MPVSASSSQAWLMAKTPGREPAEAGVFAGADAVFDPGVGAVAGLQELDRSGAGRGVGGDHLVAQAFDGVEQGQLRAGVRVVPGGR